MGGIRAEINTRTDELRGEIGNVRGETAELSQRMAKVEGLLQGLRDTTSSKRDIA